MKIRIDPLDRLFSLFVRSRSGWKCERCFKHYPPLASRLQTSHFHGRRKQSVRFDPENAAALCFFCHQDFTANPAAHMAWFEKRLGKQRFAALMIRANTPQKPDRELIKIWLKAQLKKDLL